MYSFHHPTLFLAMMLATVTTLFGQTNGPLEEEQLTNEQSKLNLNDPPQKVVVVTGARFSYTLVEKWIDEYNKVNPNVQIIIEARGSADPLKYDILAEVYEHDAEIKKNREYINVARYAVLPVANASSSFAGIYADKGLNTNLINQIFFHDIFADQENQKPIKAPFTVYTRLQKAGVPAIFSKYFGHEQKDIKGNGIAGADAHLIKALLRDSTGVTYLPLPLIYDRQTRRPVEGLVVLPVDVNGNKKVSDDEKFFDNLDRVIENLEATDPGKIANIPVEYLHLSVDRKNASAEAIDFLKWVNENGQDHLQEFGYLRPEAKHFEKEKFNAFAVKKGR